LCLVDEEGDFFELEVQESIFLVHRVAAEVVSQDDVPVETVVFVEVFLEIFGDLAMLGVTCSPSLSSASLSSVYCFLVSRMTASRISSGQSRGMRTSAPKMVLKTGLFSSVSPPSIVM
jgi:hypothetical protein